MLSSDIRGWLGFKIQSYIELIWDVTIVSTAEIKNFQMSIIHTWKPLKRIQGVNRHKRLFLKI